ncbi:MAG: quinate 5-dehydrogenase [Coriobacteriia bacterium]|nr:quinate 5-dehydrogenase [Coriobacteriia bacterium]
MDVIKEVVSVSIGSSARDHSVEIELLGEMFRISRRGTDGDLARAEALFAELDGTIDAFGMGGIDLYLRAAGKNYYFREAKKLVRGVSKTPVLDGSGLKGAVEASVVTYMHDDLGLQLRGKRVLMTSAVDRWGMTEGLRDAGCEMVYADLMYGLDIPIAIRSWSTLRVVVKMLMPVVRLMPFSVLYPVGAEQDKAPKRNERVESLYQWADIIAGDWQYVKKYMPMDMRGKWIVTNTTTPADVELARERGVELMVTSTPRLEGRSFGTNVIEATMVALKGASGELPAEEYKRLLKEVGFAPDVLWLQRSEQ